MVALIMAGGFGKRFWPLSRKSRPKQFLKIVSDEKTLLQMTFERLLPRFTADKVFVVTASNQSNLIRENLPSIPDRNIIIEPFGMNTAPCIALATAYIAEFFPPNETIVVLPSDHLIEKKTHFLELLEYALKAANKGYLVTFGIKPDKSSTAYGYIETGDEIENGIFQVKSFKEKPDLATAQEFIELGNFMWNSGMFVWKINTIEKAISEFLPEVTNLTEKIKCRWSQYGYNHDISDIYKEMPFLPVDVGIMEKAHNRLVIPVDIGWNDVGSWNAVYEISKKDKYGNVHKNKIFNIDSNNNYILSQKPVCLIGVDNTVFVETDDVILISNKEETEKVKNIVKILEESNSKELL